MNLTVNGEPYTHSGNGTVGALLKEMALDAVQVAVMVNDDIVPRDKQPGHPLAEADRVEVLTFAGGG